MPWAPAGGLKISQEERHDECHAVFWSDAGATFLDDRSVVGGHSKILGIFQYDQKKELELLLKSRIIEGHLHSQLVYM